MNLVVDIGNTQTKVAVFSQKNRVYKESLDSNEIEVFQKVFQKYSIDQAIICNVSLPNPTWISFLETHCTVFHLTPSSKIPFQNE